MLSWEYTWRINKEASMKKYSPNILNVIVIAVFLILDWIKWDCIVWINVRYNSLVSGWLFVFFVAIEMLILLIAGAINILKNDKKTSVAIVACFCILPFIKHTGVYLDINYYINKGTRENIVNLILEDQENVFYVADSHTYILPKKYRHASLTSQIIVVKGKEVNVFFDIQKGLLGGKGVIYASDCKPYKNAFGVKVKKIKEIEQCWYYIDWSY